MGRLRGACRSCAMFDTKNTHGKGTTTGWCDHPAIGRIVNGDDTCPFFVDHGGAGYDFNVGLAEWERMKQGRRPTKQAYGDKGGPSVVETSVLRSRSARDQEWGRRVA